MASTSRPDPATQWTVILAAANGCAEARASFAAHYLDIVRRYLTARWRGGEHDIDDAVQEVFLDCFRERGALRKVRPNVATEFRGYLWGVVRNVARRHEERAHRRRAIESNGIEVEQLAQEFADEATPSVAFDQAWARATLARAVKRQRDLAQRLGADAERRVELLRLRFADELPIREIARAWQVRADWLHHQYAQARADFREALLAELRLEGVGPTRSAEQECDMLLQMLRRPSSRQRSDA